MPTQRFTGETVLAAAQRRIAFVFDHYAEIVCSISGGKDSTALAHLALSEAQRRGRRIGLFLLDEEVLYQSSVDQVDYLMGLFPEVTKKLWLQIPFRLTNATSVVEGQLQCWEPGDHKLWMRPKKDFAIKGKPWSVETETVACKAKGFGFYDVIDNFERTFHGVAFLVGLRAAGESPNRWRTVTKHPIEVGGKQVYWGTRKGDNASLYPIFDWNFHDVWKYIHQEGLKYSKVYDYQFKKGYPINQMRVSSLIHERAFKSICDLPEFEPKTYAKLCKRVKGIALAQETGKAARLFRCSKLPQNFTSWRTYRDFLLSTHLDRERLPIFQERFARQADNEYVARQQCRQLVLNDYENNLPIDSRPDPREQLIAYYREVL
jgi:predicted phosphoadenosine phosphosulfate sulfurtransferase